MDSESFDEHMDFRKSPAQYKGCKDRMAMGKSGVIISILIFESTRHHGDRLGDGYDDSLIG